MSRGAAVTAAVAAAAVAGVAAYLAWRPVPPPPPARPRPGARPARASDLPPLPPLGATHPTPSARTAEAGAGGRLTIESDVEGASVFIDRRYLGKAPVTVDDVPPGPHRLNVSAEGYDGYAEPVEVTGGPQTVVARLREVRLDARLAVVHKHALGSCRGTLSATPAGLRYEASKPADAFAVPLASVTSLKVDYLGKTLRVGLAGGRSYTFAEASGNADALVTFQQQVDRARARP